MSSDLDKLAYEIAARDAAWSVLPIVLADMDTGEVLYASVFAAGIFGYEAAEIVGQSVEMLIPEDVRDAHSRWRQDASVPVTRLMGVGRQIRGRKKDGTLFPVHVGLTATTVHGRQIGIAFIVDLTGVSA